MQKKKVFIDRSIINQSTTICFFSSEYFMYHSRASSFFDLYVHSSSKFSSPSRNIYIKIILYVVHVFQRTFSCQRSYIMNYYWRFHWWHSKIHLRDYSWPIADLLSTWKDKKDIFFVYIFWREKLIWFAYKIGKSRSAK